ncbi:MAG: hypothetical protein HYZ84_07485 [Candidatus Omnitrophica bacterium]|nr:hypothetical protein [Candidatus Omnitrophota bacterium]
MGGILKWYLAGTYQLAQIAARASRRSGFPSLGCLLLVFLLALWSSGHMISVLSWLWQHGWFRGFLLSLVFLWCHYFLLCFALSSLGLERKSRKMKGLRAALDKSNSKQIIGMDLVKAKELLISEIDWSEHLQVLGSGIHARNFLQKALEADIRHGHQILLFAPEIDGLLEEVTYILRERDPKEIQALFYFSLNRPEISASYSPFYGNSFEFLRDWLKLVKDGREAFVLERLMKSLTKNGKPYELDDLLVLLKDKRAAMALNEIELTREYIWDFDSFKKARDSLAEKLSKLGTKMKLEKYPITQGYPLDFQDILQSKKHLFIELGQRGSFFMTYFLTHLFYEMTRSFRNRHYNAPAIYLILPEEFEEQYPLEQYFKELKLEAKFRLFSTRFSPLYSEEARWNSIILPTIPESERKKPECEAFMKEIEKERERLEEQSNFKALFNEETFESSSLLIKEMGISTCAGFFSKYGRGHYLDCRLFYAPESEPKKLEYEPYQKKIKPENMLRLRQRIGRIKLDLQKHDPSVLEIIHDLKPRNDGPARNLGLG